MLRTIVLSACSFGLASACDFCGGAAAIRSTPAGGAWSSPATWQGNVVPRAGDPVVITEGGTVTLDAVTPALASVKIGGVLRAAAAVDSALTAGWIMVDGAGSRLEAGSETQPYARRLVITLTGTDRAVNVTGVAPFTSGSKFLMAMNGGAIALHGASRDKTPWTVLGAHAAAGATQLTLAMAPISWAVGDQICIAPTGFEPMEAERVTITGSNIRRTDTETVAPVEIGRALCRERV